MTATVRQLLQAKGNMVHSATPDSTVFDALERMSAYDVGALLVLDGSELVGIFSERDYARKVILMGRSSKETLVREVMTDDLITITPDATVGDCMNLMTGNRIRHLPVVENGQLVGVVSIGDVVKAIMTQQELMITEMEAYITGSR